MVTVTELTYDALFRYFHILSGITWIGLLYFFNLVNLPLLKFDLKKPFTVDMAEKASAAITAKTLFWFRWGAMSTLVFGLALIEMKRRQYTDGLAGYFFDSGLPGYFILMGVVFGIIMWFNVWFIIWPAQQVILRNNKKIAGGVSDEEKQRLQAENAPRVKNAVTASRTNTWLSVPMLFGMVFGAHGREISTKDWEPFYGPILVLLVVLLIMVFMSFRGKKA